MTVLRREDVQSKVASWDDGPYRIALSPILTFVPLVVRRLRGPVTEPLTLPARSVPSGALLRPGDGGRLECGPQKPRELARDRDGDLRCRLMFGRHFPKAPTQPLLRLVGDR